VLKNATLGCGETPRVSWGFARQRKKATGPANPAAHPFGAYHPQSLENVTPKQWFFSILPGTGRLGGSKSQKRLPLDSQ